MQCMILLHAQFLLRARIHWLPPAMHVMLSLTWRWLGGVAYVLGDIFTVPVRFMIPLGGLPVKGLAAAAVQGGWGKKKP
jgi:hypothetical protein